MITLTEKGNIMSREEMIEKILKSKPPYDKSDIYYTRDNWSRYGGISSGAYVCWCWFKSVRELPDDELLELYNKVVIQ
jgi:hypothetical protein